MAAGSGPESKPAQVASRAGDEVGNVAETATEGVLDVADEVRTQAKEMVGHAKEQFDEFFDQARQEVGEQARQRSEQAAGQLRTLSNQIVALAEGRPESAGSLAGLLYDAEDRVRGLATRLEQGGPQGVKNDLSNFARRRPGAFLATAVGVGFVIGRAVRAGSSAQQSGGTAAESVRTPTVSSQGYRTERTPLPVGAGSAAPVSGMPQ
jgi:hypothetical protein